MSDRDAGETFGIDRFYDTARIKRAAKNFETALAKNFSKIDKFYSKTAIRFIATVSTDRLAISEAVERSFDLDVARSLENRREHSFGYRENVLRRYKRRFDVDLRKFRLSIGPQIFVAKTFRDLKIFLHAGYHKQLFVLLRRLGQRIKFSRCPPARHQKVARAFRRAFR